MPTLDSNKVVRLRKFKRLGMTKSCQSCQSCSILSMISIATDLLYTTFGFVTTACFRLKLGYMSKRSRYLLIFICLILFAVLAPATIFYSMGLDFNWHKGTLTKTGILAFITEPKEPNIFLDGSLKKQPVNTLRFLKPKDYSLKFEFPTYCSWQKRLPVNPGEVTWASPFDGKIYLLKYLPEAKQLDTGVIDFYYKNNSVLTLKPDSLNVISLKNLSNKKYPLTDLGTNITLLSNDSEYLINSEYSASARQFSVFEQNSGSIKEIPGDNKDVNKILGLGGSYFILSKNTLYSFEPKTGIKNPLFTNILDFSLLSGDGYVLSKEENSSILLNFAINSPSQINKIAELPKFSEAKLFITEQKQIFVLGDGQLHQVGLTTKVLGAAQEIGFDQSSPNLIYYGNGEIDFFDFGSNQQKLISRTSEKIHHPLIASNLGYAIWQKNQVVEALELDSRDAQNSCVLYQGQNIKKIMADQENRRLFILDGEELKVIEIR